MLLRLVALARAPVELAEAEVAVGDEGTHTARLGEGQRLAVVVGSVLGATRRRDVTAEAKGVSFGCPCLQPMSQRQRVSGVAGGLVDPPSRKVRHARVQRNSRG